MTNKCVVCGYDYESDGALIISPPDSQGKCIIYHICVRCFHLVPMGDMK